MRIIGGQWRGRTLAAPPGWATRPTADRARQALFDRLAHAPWAAGLLHGRVLDVFAGTGGLGLEALSRGAERGWFIEQAPAALGCLRANIAICGALDRALVLARDATRPIPAPEGACALILMDPPYGQSLVPRALAALRQGGWVGPDTVMVAELGRDEAVPAITDLHGATLVTEWRQGAARMVAWRG